MDIEQRGDSNQRRKQKKKKHQRSRSDSRKHKKDRASSRDRKKDKDKKKHKSKSRSREQRRDRPDERRDRNDERRDRHEDRKQVKVEERREKVEERRVEEREDMKSREHSERREKQRDVERPKERQKDREKDRQRERERDKDRDRDHKQKERKKDRSRSKRRDERSRSRDKRQKRKNEDRDRERRRDRRQDKYQRWRKEANFRFDSPPKSDDSDGSDDAQKVDRLNKMKAEKELVSSKADRKLYLGNLPPNITSNQLMQMLNTALKKMEINCEQEGDSIVSAWISPDGVGHYAFVQFRTAQEATAGLALNGASLYGYQLKLGRPKQYIEYHKQLLSQFGSDGNIDTILRKVLAMGGFELEQPPKIQERLVYPPSRVVVLKHVVTVQQLAIDEEYTEIMEDVADMAKRHGDVVKVVIPRPMEIDLQQVKKRVKGLGYIFIKYKSVEQAKYARKEFIKQMFSQRSVACGFFPEKGFEEGELDVIDKVVIDF